MKIRAAFSAAAFAGLVLSVVSPNAATAQAFMRGGVPPYEVAAIVRSAGLVPASPPLRRGGIYIMRAIDPYRRPVRVVIDAGFGDILSITHVAAVDTMEPYGRGYRYPAYEGPRVLRYPPEAASPEDESPRAEPSPPAARQPSEPPRISALPPSETGSGQLPPRFKPSTKDPAAIPPDAATQAPPPIPLPRPRPTIASVEPAPPSANAAELSHPTSAAEASPAAAAPKSPSANAAESSPSTSAPESAPAGAPSTKSAENKPDRVIEFKPKPAPPESNDMPPVQDLE